MTAPAADEAGEGRVPDPKSGDCRFVLEPGSV